MAIRLLQLFLLVLLILPLNLFAQVEEETKKTPSTYVGLEGNFTRSAGSNQSSLFLSLGHFVKHGSAVSIAIQGELGQTQIRELTASSIELSLISLYSKHELIRPYLIGGIGVSQESLGGFGANRIPLNLGSGIRIPIRTATDIEKLFIQVEYRYRYLLNDPIAAFSIHQATLGLAFYIN